MNTLMAKALFKKTTLYATAFVLAVSTLTAAVPFILSKEVGAVGGVTAIVTDEASLVAAASNPDVNTISIKASFSTAQKTVFSGRNVYVDGNGNKVSFIGDTAGWQGNYVFQSYANTVTIKNLAISGGDAAIYANGATLNLQGTVNVSGNEFGGIEVSQGSGVTTPAILNAGLALVNTNEANAKPSAWTDKVSTANATVNGSFTTTTHIGTNQKQYYLYNANTGIVATNSTTVQTYGTLQAAFDAAHANDTIVLNKSIEIPAGGVAAHIDTPVAFNGNGLTIKTTSARGSAGDQKNAALIVGSTATGTTVKNLTVEGISGSSASHGIIVHAAQNVKLLNITAKNNASGVVVNGAEVTIDGITTAGNNWHGINVDKPGAKLTIKGAISQNEAAPIFVDNRAIAQVVDTDERYDVVAIGASDLYVFDVTGPSITWQLQPAPLVKDQFAVRPITSGETITTKSVYIDSVSVANLCWTLTSDHLNFDTSNDSCPILAASLASGTHKFIAVFVDKNGNSTTSSSDTFVIDRTGPTITVKPGSLGDITTGIFQNVSFSLFDANQVDKVTLNGVLKDLSNNNYSDLNSVKPGQFGAVAGVNTLVVFDALGNTTTLSFTLDIVAPNATFTYSNNNGSAVTNQDVIVTLTANEPIQTPTGWTKVSATQFTKVYGANFKGSVAISDIAGNSASKNYEVKRIDKAAPTIAGVADTATYRGVVGSIKVTDQNFSQLSINGTAVTTQGVGGWDYVPVTSVSGNGTYVLKATDKGGNVTLLTFTVDNSTTSFVDEDGIDTTSPNPSIAGRTTYDVDNAPVANEPIVVDIDGVEYETRTDNNGDWAVTARALTDGEHVVKVNDAVIRFTTKLPTVEEVVVTADPVVTSGEPTTPIPLASPVVPTIVNPSTFAGVLGTTTDNTPNNDGAAVEGTSTKNILAAAANSDANRGAFLGLNWYWWLLIVAAVAGTAWWIFGAIRNRQFEN